MVSRLHADHWGKMILRVTDHSRPGLEYRRPGLEYRRPGLEYRHPGLEYRHPGLEYRHPGLDPGSILLFPRLWKKWIPAFAGMTEVGQLN
jgi:hypothetical protein